MKNVPLRCWSMGSYDPSNGRAASSLQAAGSNTTIEGQVIKPNPQLPRRDNAEGGGQTLAAFDARNTQNPTPVSKRPIG